MVNATITITEGYEVGDVLRLDTGFDSQTLTGLGNGHSAEIGGSWDSLGRQLLLQGAGTARQFQRVISHVEFRHDSKNPLNNKRKFDIVVNDGSISRLVQY
jgi:hypothetical protein